MKHAHVIISAELWHYNSCAAGTQYEAACDVRTECVSYVQLRFFNINSNMIILVYT
jgi:hypothetical protein